MKLAYLLAVLTSGLIYRAAAADTPSTGVIQIDNKAVAAAFAKGGLLINTNNFKVMAGRRVEPGKVEIHEKDTDVFYITDGSATFVTGGTAVKPHTIAPNEIQAQEILYLRRRLNDIYVQHTGQPLDKIERDMERDRFMSAEAAMEYGLIDQVLDRRAIDTVKSA